MSTTDHSRVEFEAWISALPYEKNIDRFVGGTCHKNYIDIEVDLAWCAWDAARVYKQAPINKQSVNCTPGPWEIVYRDDERFMCMTCVAQKGAMGDTMNVCRLQDDPNAEKVIAITFHQSNPPAGLDFENGVEDANTRLIAASPEMFEVLQEIVSISDRKHEAWDKAKEVIRRVCNG